MDAYAYGRYPRAAIQYLKSLGCAPIFEEGDEALMKKAASLIDFMGVNYYQTCVVEYNDINGVGSDHTMNNTGKKVPLKFKVYLVFLKKHKMSFYQQQIGIGQLIQWELECVVVKLLRVIIYQF